MRTGFSHFRLTSTLSAIVAAFAIAATTQSQAAGTHPVTGEALADDQTFTYRLLDQAGDFCTNEGERIA